MYAYIIYYIASAEYPSFSRISELQQNIICYFS